MYAQHRDRFEEHLHRAEPKRRVENRGDRKPASAPAGDGEDDGAEGPDER